jgi:hypothetical protein
VGEGVRVHALTGRRGRMRSGRRLDHVWVLQVRRRLHRRGELGGELAEREVLAPPLDQSERGAVPEARASAVPEQDLITVRQREEGREPAADATDDRAHARLAVRRAEVPTTGCRKMRDGLLPNLGGAAAEPAVPEEEGGGDLDVGNHLLCHPGKFRGSAPASDRLTCALEPPGPGRSLEQHRLEAAELVPSG